MKESLYKHHSYAACIGEGYRFLAKHLLLVTRIMAPYYTLSSLFFVLSAAFAVKTSVAIQTDTAITTTDLAVTYLAYLLGAIVTLLSVGRTFLMFRRLTGSEMATPDDVSAKPMAAWKKTLRRTLQLSWRALPYSIWGILVNIPGFSPMVFFTNIIKGLEPGYQILVSVIAVTVYLVVLTLAMPLLYSFYCRMMRPTFIDTTTEEGKAQSEAFRLKPAYRKAFNHKGKIFGVALLSAFLVGIACFVLLLPCFISSQAYFSSVEGRINFCDTLLIPTSAYAYMFIVATVSLTLGQLFAIAMQASLLYLFGDIFSAEK